MSTMFFYLGVGVKTLQRWDREGRLTPSSAATTMPIAYCRVLRRWKPGDFSRRVALIRTRHEGRGRRLI
jgi:hypothetical protein